jgi:hypothetical protein
MDAPISSRDETALSDIPKVAMLLGALFRRYISERVSGLILFWSYVTRRDLNGYRGSGGTAREVLGHGTSHDGIAPKYLADPAAIAQFTRFERLSRPSPIGRRFTMLNSQIRCQFHPPGGAFRTRAPQSARRRVQVPIERGRGVASILDAKPQSNIGRTISLPPAA